MRRDLTLDLSKTAPFLKENELDYIKAHPEKFVFDREYEGY